MSKQLLRLSRPPARTWACAALVALGLSVNLTGASSEELTTLFGNPTGPWGVIAEVLCSFPARGEALLVLGAALLLMPLFAVAQQPAVRRAGGRAAWAVSACFAAAMVWGRSFDEVGSAALVVGSPAACIRAVLAAASWLLAAHAVVCVLFALLDRWRGAVGEQPAAAGARGPLHGAFRWVVAFVADRHPLMGPAAVLALCWLPVLVGYAPALFMWDTNTQILQWFGLPNHISSSVVLLDPAVLLTQHHPPLHTALVGLCVQAGRAIAGSENLGIFLYAVLQWTLDIAAIAWALRLTQALGVPRGARLGVLVFLAVVPAFSNYSVLVTKDVLFADALLVWAMELVYLVVCARGEHAYAPHHVVLLVVGALGTTLLRSGMLLVVAGGTVTACVVLGRRHQGVAGRPRRYLRYPFAALALAVGVSLTLSHIVYPVLHITPASNRELLSIPLQQVARVLRDHPRAVQPAERRALGRVVDVQHLAELYNPSKSDPVKATFNERATSADVAAALQAWLHILLRDPACCLTATAANYYGYVYPARAMSWSYTSYFSRQVMANTETNLIYSDIASYFSFSQPPVPLVQALDGLCSGYRLVFQRLPLTTLTMQAALYTWTLVLVTAYAAHRRLSFVAVVLVPAWLVLLVALVGPCNATTYFRYAYPVALLTPFVAALLGMPHRAPSSRCTSVCLQPHGSRAIEMPRPTAAARSAAKARPTTATHAATKARPETTTHAATKTHPTNAQHGGAQ